MKHFIFSALIAALFCFSATAQSNNPEYLSIAMALEDVTELHDFETALALVDLESKKVEADPTHLNRLRLGVLYYEVAALSPRRNKETIKLVERGYALLTVLKNDDKTDKALRPYIAAYQASALAILGYYQESSKLINQAFYYFDQAVAQHGEDCYAPRYMRAKIARFLPSYYSKRSTIKKDLTTIIDRYGLDYDFATNKAMSHVYYSWVDLYGTKGNRTKSINYLKRSIDLDPNNIAAGEQARKVLEKFNQAEHKLTAAR